MSAVGLSALEAFGIQALGSIGIIKPQRSIGGIVADCTIEEDSTDEVAITQHPVEKTADITDHAYPLPARLTIRIGFSPSGGGQGTIPFGILPSIGDPTPLPTIYQQFLALKDARTLMVVQTGKRLYRNMLIKTITVVTDKDSENALFMTLDLQQLILVSTQTVTVPPNSVQANPKNTANTLNAGAQSAIPNPQTFNAAGIPALP